MKLKLKEIQLLDFLFKKFSYEKNLNSKFNIVVKIDNSIWHGDFIPFEKNCIRNYTVDSDLDLKYSDTYLHHVMLILEEIKLDNHLKLYNKCENNYILPLFFNAFKDIIDKNAIVNFEPYNILYNAVNLSTHTKLPFMYLTADEYEVVSLIEIKDECTDC